MSEQTPSTSTEYRGRHRWMCGESDRWRIRGLISKTNLPHNADPRHAVPEDPFADLPEPFWDRIK